MKQMELCGTRGALLVGVAVLASACSNDSTTNPKELTPVSSLAVIRCSGDVASSTLSCGDASDQSDLRSNLIIGGQGTYVKLSANPTTVPGPNTVTITNVRLQNLMAKPLGTTDGITQSADGIRIFFHDLGNVVGVANADGFGNFTGSHQAYFNYGGPVASGATSAGRDWTLELAPGTTTYTFTVYVSAALLRDNEYLRWNSEVPLGSASTAFYGSWGLRTDELYMAGTQGRIVRFNGTTYTPMATGLASTINLYDIWGTSAANIYAVGLNGTVVRFDGTSWGPVAGVPSTARNLFDVSGSSASNVFASGQAFDGGVNRAAVQHFDGTSWTQTVLSTTSNSVAYGTWSPAPGEAFTVGSVGSGGAIWRLSGGSWSSMTIPATSALYGVWGISPTKVYAVGAANAGTAVLLEYDGTSWTRIPLTQNTFLWKIGGDNSNNLYAVGGNTGAGTSATILHFDGTTWRSELSPSTGLFFYSSFSVNGANVVTGSSSAIFRSVR